MAATRKTDQHHSGNKPDHDHNALTSLGAELLRRADESQPVLEAAWHELLAGWGVHGEPMNIPLLRAHSKGMRHRTGQ